MAIVASKDYGEDEPSAQALLQRHRDLQGELNAYSGDIQSLNSQAEKLVKAGISTLEVGCGITFTLAPVRFFSFNKTEFYSLFLSLQLSAEPEPLTEVDGADEEEWVNEVRLVPQEVWEEEPIERTEYRTVTEERLVPQVRSSYPFSGQGMLMEKGEVLSFEETLTFLLSLWYSRR